MLKGLKILHCENLISKIGFDTAEYDPLKILFAHPHILKHTSNGLRSSFNGLLSPHELHGLGPSAAAATALKVESGLAADGRSSSLTRRFETWRIASQAERSREAQLRSSLQEKNRFSVCPQSRADHGFFC